MAYLFTDRRRELQSLEGTFCCGWRERNLCRLFLLLKTRMGITGFILYYYYYYLPTSESPLRILCEYLTFTWINLSGNNWLSLSGRVFFVYVCCVSIFESFQFHHWRRRTWLVLPPCCCCWPMRRLLVIRGERIVNFWEIPVKSQLYVVHKQERIKPRKRTTKTQGDDEKFCNIFFNKANLFR